MDASDDGSHNSNNETADVADHDNQPDQHAASNDDRGWCTPTLRCKYT